MKLEGFKDAFIVYHPSGKYIAVGHHNDGVLDVHPVSVSEAKYLSKVGDLKVKKMEELHPEQRQEIESHPALAGKDPMAKSVKKTNLGLFSVDKVKQIKTAMKHKREAARNLENYEKHKEALLAPALKKMEQPEVTSNVEQAMMQKGDVIKFPSQRIKTSTPMTETSRGQAFVDDEFEPDVSKEYVTLHPFPKMSTAMQGALAAHGSKKPKKIGKIYGVNVHVALRPEHANLRGGHSGMNSVDLADHEVHERAQNLSSRGYKDLYVHLPEHKLLEFVKGMKKGTP